MSFYCSSFALFLRRTVKYYAALFIIFIVPPHFVPAPCFFSPPVARDLLLLVVDWMMRRALLSSVRGP